LQKGQATAVATTKDRRRSLRDDNQKNEQLQLQKERATATTGVFVRKVCAAGDGFPLWQ
jgi:hypothetical protein